MKDGYPGIKGGLKSAPKQCVMDKDKEQDSLSLRDYYIGQAMNAIAQKYPTPLHLSNAQSFSAFSDACVRLAEAMLMARQRKQ